LKKIILLFCIFFSIISFAQDSTSIHFTTKLNDEIVQLQNEYNFNNEHIKLTNFKFYISNICYYTNNSFVYRSSENAYLIDLADSNSLIIHEKIPSNFNKITFNIGIDSINNVAGLLSDDLDPANGMYWTWQSGYINLKLEGIASNCPARFNKFYWHIGGYMSPFNSIRQVTLYTQQTKKIEVNIQLNQLFNCIDIAQIYQIMSPSKKAMEIADKIPSIFKIVD
jgi:hypothetical protein